MTTVKESPNGSKSPSLFRSVVSKLKPTVASVSSAAQQPTPSPLKSQISDLPSPENVLRCEFTFSDGRQCRYPAKVYPQDELSPVKDKKVANRRAPFCAHHATEKRGGKGAALKAPELEALCSDLTTATSINRALAQTFLLMAQGRISRKDAVAFGYLSQLMLQSISGVRAEYVAAFGYRRWETKLKTSLMPNADEDPEPSPGGANTHSAVSSSKSDDQARTVIPSEQRERGIPPKPLPVNKVKRERRISPNVPQERPLAERIMGKPDYADILSRSLDMLDRKYDATPEGRCEANKLALELELMKPAPAKPPRDYFGRVVELVRRCREGEARNAAAGPEPSSLPPEAFLNYYGHPIRLAVPPAGGTATPDPNPSASRSEPPTAHDLQTCSSGRGETGVSVLRDAEPALRPLDQDLAESSQLGLPQKPESKRNARSARRKPRARTAAPPPSLPGHPLQPSIPVASPDGSDDEHHEGHRTDWYAPPSWSSIRPPDPCPSRKEKLQRKIRGLTNSAFRRLQHQNSRGFWNRGLQKLTP
jgi:hypothetical protein